MLCYEHDRWHGENILVHEFAHTLKSSGLERVDATFASRVKSAYDAAIARGRYRGLYAGTNPEEYFAEGVQDYFGVHQMRTEHDVHTKDELRAYDPALFAIIDGVLRSVALPSACPSPELASTSGWIRLRNLAGGTLDVQNGGAFDPVVVAPGNFSGQMWSAAPNGDGSFRLTTMFLGQARALDTRNDGIYEPEMARAGAYSGQRWMLTPVTRGTYRLTNVFLGTSRSLEARADKSVAMARSSDARTQLWMIQ